MGNKNYSKTKLKEIVNINPTEKIEKGTIAKYVPMSNITEFNKKIYKTELKEYKGGMKFRNGDILFARITPCLENGKTAFVDFLDKGEIGFGSTEYIVLREKGNISDKHYLYYLSISPEFRRRSIKLMSGTSGRQRVQLNAFKNLEISLPPLPEQKRIANILSSFDNKIELLREQNKTLENIAQTIFKQWFIDFNFPDSNGKPYKDNGGEMVDSELGMIPKGWVVGKLGNIVECLDSKRIPLSKKEREKRPGPYPYYGATGIMDYIDDYLFEGLHLLLAEDGSVQNEQGHPILQLPSGKFWVSNHAHVLKGKGSYSTEYIYFLLRKAVITNLITGAVQPKINQTNLLNFKVITPSDLTLQDFRTISERFIGEIKYNEVYVKSLTNIKLLLLKKLL